MFTCIVFVYVLTIYVWLDKVFEALDEFSTERCFCKRIYQRVVPHLCLVTSCQTTPRTTYTCKKRQHNLIKLVTDWHSHLKAGGFSTFCGYPNLILSTVIFINN